MPGIFNTYCVQVINDQVQCTLYSNSQNITGFTASQNQSLPSGIKSYEMSCC